VYAPLLIVAGGYLGRWAGRRLPPRLAALGACLLAAYFLFGVLLTEGPAKAPIGYANANAAVAGQLMALAGLLTLSRTARGPAWLAVILALLTTLASQSKAAVALAVPLLVLLVLVTAGAPFLRHRWGAVVLSLLSVSAAGLGLVSLARTISWHPALVDAFDDVRRILWIQAWGAFRTAEEFGGGPGRFENVNILGLDSDQSSAHSLPLQVAVELGGLGLALLAALFILGLAVACRAPTPPATWLAVGGWTMLTLHAATDHLLEYWPVTTAAGLVLGYALVAQAYSHLEDQPVEHLGAGPGGS
jgi:O-antigen ligase